MSNHPNTELAPIFFYKVCHHLLVDICSAALYKIEESGCDWPTKVESDRRHSRKSILAIADRLMKGTAKIKDLNEVEHIYLSVLDPRS